MIVNHMRRRAFSVALACLCGLAVPPSGWAQTTPDQVIEQYRAWTVTCARAAAEGEAAPDGQNCAMEQSLKDKDSGATVMRIRIAAGPGAPAPVGSIQGPFGVDLARGLVLAVDGVAFDPIAYRTCLSTGCIADLPLDEARVAAMRSGETLVVSMRPADNPEREVTLTFSLLGFADALTRVQAAAP